MPVDDSARTIVVGDIHGCSVAFDAVIEALKLQPTDTLVILGDFIDRGPGSRDVLERLVELKTQCRLVPLIGNHEEMLLAAREGKSDLKYWKKFGGQETLDSYGGLADCSGIPWAHVRFIRECRLFFETETHIFVHAGVAPNLPMENQSSLDLLWKPLVEAEAAPHYSGKTVIVGHTPQRSGRVLDLGFLKCIDTLCYDGGVLTALDADAGRVWQATLHGDLQESILECELRGEVKKCG